MHFQIRKFVEEFLFIHNFKGNSHKHLAVMLLQFMVSNKTICDWKLFVLYCYYYYSVLVTVVKKINNGQTVFSSHFLKSFFVVRIKSSGNHF